MKKVFLLLLSLFLSVSGCQNITGSGKKNPETITIVYPVGAGSQETLAAREVQRYTYLRTGKLPAIIQSDKKKSSNKDLIVIGPKNSRLIKTLTAGGEELKKNINALQSQEYRIKTIKYENSNVTIIAGGDSIGTLYGAYRYAELLGVRFYMHGDTIPDKKIDMKLPEVDDTGKPLFELRGILPYHDFAEGPDWWNIDDYKSILSQIVKLRMNFVGFHTYLQSSIGPEPTVWVGLPEDIKEDGKVKFSYPSFYNHTLHGTWGYVSTKTSDYSFGASQLFDCDNYSGDVVTSMASIPEGIDKHNEFFNRVGGMFKEAFEYAHNLDIKTCVGTEAPLIVPKPLDQRLKKLRGDRYPGHPEIERHPQVVAELYSGIFERIKRLYPLDYYWLWSPEYWIWQPEKGNKEVEKFVEDVLIAERAARQIDAPFTLATCGWVLGPAKDTAMFDNLMPKQMPMSCINGMVGFSPVDKNFASIKGRDLWAIPWLEDDPAMTIPQLWAGRMRRDAADALRYGCNGLMGIHWRTRILGPNVLALAKAGWQQKDWNPFLNGDCNDSDVKSRDLPVDDFYLDWAKSQFGEDGVEQIASIFCSLDGAEDSNGHLNRTANLPRPADWEKGPGAIKANNKPWQQVKARYAFVEQLEKLRDEIKGAGNLERFDYWLDNFRYLKAMGKVSCTLGRLKTVMEKINKEEDVGIKKQLAEEKAVVILRQMVDEFEQMHRYLFATVKTNGSLGVVANVQQHEMDLAFDKYQQEVKKILGESYREIELPKAYCGSSAYLIVPTVRTVLTAGELLNLKVIVLDDSKAHDVAVYWRPMGKGKFNKVVCNHINRGVYKVTLPKQAAAQGLEYYIKAVTDKGDVLKFPASAPSINQTVVIMPN